jgi:hypothetical protein
MFVFQINQVFINLVLILSESLPTVVYEKVEYQLSKYLFGTLKCIRKKENVQTKMWVNINHCIVKWTDTKYIKLNTNVQQKTQTLTLTNTEYTVV